MTRIHKTTQRCTSRLYSVLTRKERPIVVACEPGDVLTFRELGCRARFSIPIDHVFRLAIKIQVEADRRARREKRRTGA